MKGEKYAGSKEEKMFERVAKPFASNSLDILKVIFITKKTTEIRLIFHKMWCKLAICYNYRNRISDVVADPIA